jgi:hypothetical protein
MNADKTSSVMSIFLALSQQLAAFRVGRWPDECVADPTFSLPVCCEYLSLAREYIIVVGVLKDCRQEKVDVLHRDLWRSALYYGHWKTLDVSQNIAECTDTAADVTSAVDQRRQLLLATSTSSIFFLNKATICSNHMKHIPKYHI